MWTISKTNLGRFHWRVKIIIPAQYEEAVLEKWRCQESIPETIMERWGGGNGVSEEWSREDEQFCLDISELLSTGINILPDNMGG